MNPSDINIQENLCPTRPPPPPLPQGSSSTSSSSGGKKAPTTKEIFSPRKNR